MRTRRMLGMVVATVLLGGCATRMDTKSGGPEVTIKGVPMDIVRTAYAHELADEGFRVQRTNDGTLIGLKKAVVGSDYGNLYEPRKAIVRLKFLQEDDEVRVVYRGFLGDIYRGDIVGGEGREDWKDRQRKLERVAEKLEEAR